MQDTSISWCDWVWNPIRGCSRISPGCLNCYAEAIAARFSGVDYDASQCDEHTGSLAVKQPFHGFAEFRIIGGKNEAHWTGKVGSIESKLLEPLSWRKKALKFAAKHGRKPRAFISMSDLFHENLPDKDLYAVFAVMLLCPEVLFMILTKRAERLRTLDYQPVIDAANRLGVGVAAIRWPLPNVALGVSVESQKYAGERIPHLLRTPAEMRFVSYEPALEAVDFHLPNPYQRIPGGYRGDRPDLMIKPDMIIVGGESGHGARPFDLAWARQTVKQCRESGVACFVKQLGSRPFVTHDFPNHPFARQDVKDKKGEDMSEWPEDLRVRQWPEGWD